MDDRDKRVIPVAFKLPRPDLAALDELRGDGTRSATAREVILARLGLDDTARRPAPRRPNKRQRVQKVKGGKSPVVTVTLSPREAEALDGQRGAGSRPSAARELLQEGLRETASEGETR